MRPRPYDAVLCDIEDAQGLPRGALAAAAFAPARLHPAITGQVTDEDWRSAVAADLAAVCGSPSSAQAAVAAWAEAVPDVDPVVVELLTRVRAVVPVALVSNATTRLEADLADQGLTDLADIVVNTARIGVAKPDPRVYRIAAGRVGSTPRRCLFVDDTEANAAAAREVGMSALHYRRPDDLRDALEPLLSRSPDRHGRTAP